MDEDIPVAEETVGDAAESEVTGEDEVGEQEIKVKASEEQPIEEDIEVKASEEQQTEEDTSNTEPNMANVDPAFKNIPKNLTCFLVWRIEKMQVVAVPKDQYGKLYRGDSYIIFCSTEYGQQGGVNMKQKEARSGLEMHIHFWLGSSTSQDEAGVAAYKTVELDDYLGGSPVQHREAEGSESKRFLSYFKDGLTLLEGGAASGFNHVSTEFIPRLYQIKGKRAPIVKQCKQIDWACMNDGDVFLLDCKDVIFVWNGKNANRMEKIQAAKTAQKFKGDHGKSHIVIVEDGEEAKLPSNEREYLNNHLKIAEKNVRPASEATPDEVIERKVTTDIKLYRCSDEGGTLKVTEVKQGPLVQADLFSDDSFIIDNGEHGIWVWVGKKASQKERTEAMRNAQGFIKKKGYTATTQVTRVIDGGEPTEFKSLFKVWKDKHSTTGLGKVSGSRIAKTVQTRFDAATLHDNRQLSAETQMVDDGSGQKEIWRVENFDLATVDPKDHGKFYSGDCYVILYAYTTGSSDHYIIYYWLGSKSSADEQGTAALKSVELDDRLGGKPVQVRVVQGKEPQHFMSMFAGKMTVFSGGKASSFDGPEGRDEHVSDVYLMHVRGTTQYNSKAVQVELRAASLNSNDVFMLRRHNNVYVWAGKGSTGDEREMAKQLASQGPAEPVMVYEGQEKPDFWEAIGGKEPYSNDKRLMQDSDQHQIRLFQCSNGSGKFTVEEIVNFEQVDLIEEDVLLLDAWDSLFVWIGQESNKTERDMSEKMAVEYLRTDPAGRDADTPIIKVKQRFEPPNFTGFFGVWDLGLWNNNKSYEQLKAELQSDNPGISTVNQNSVGTNGTADLPKYPLDVLRVHDVEKLPEAVDPSKKELYLSDEDFHTAFGMMMADFESLPTWKRQTLKKQAGLF